ncbi:MAG: hypothetical protein K6U08_02280 [Firmicutes bacterium]|nr:hypothetical protein [Bacillota bacterium]
MSVVSSYRTRITLSPRPVGKDGLPDPTWELMRQAVEVTAQELGGTVGDHILDAYGRTFRCEFAVTTPAFPRGVGVRVGPDGEVTFVYDHYDAEGRGYRRAAAEISERITQNYAALAVARALAEMNYSVEIDEAQEGGARAVVVRGSL